MGDLLEEQILISSQFYIDTDIMDGDCFKTPNW